VQTAEAFARLSDSEVRELRGSLSRKPQLVFINDARKALRTHFGIDDAEAKEIEEFKSGETDDETDSEEEDDEDEAEDEAEVEVYF
jgi:hypothetical protein